MHGLSVCERLRQFRKLFALLVLEIYANYVGRWRGSDRTRESLAKAKTVCRGRKLHASKPLDRAAVNDSTFYIYISLSLFFSRFLFLLLYPFPPVCRNIRKRKKRRSFVGYCIHSYDFFILFSIHSRNYVIILSVPMLYVVSVFRNENVYNLFRIYFTFFLLSLSPFLRGTGCARRGREVYLFWESNPCYSLLPHRREYVIVTGSKRNNTSLLPCRTLIPERKKEFASSSNSRLWSFWVY